MKTISIKDLSQLNVAAEQFFQIVPKDAVVAFYGSMGAGKTTFITALCKYLGVEDVVNSPTFTIVNEYCDTEGTPIYHFDFYRLNKPQEAMDIGFDEYVYSGNLCLMEWPENVEELLPEDVVKVSIKVNEDDSRTIEIA